MPVLGGSCRTSAWTDHFLLAASSPLQVTALKPLKASKSRPGSSSKLSKAARESGGGPSASQGGTPAVAPKAGGGGTGRVHMAAPTAPRAPRLGRTGGGPRSNKNKRLFEGEEGALVNGQKLFYRTTQVGCCAGWNGSTNSR